MKKLFSLVAVLLSVVMLSTTAFAASKDPVSIYRQYLKNSEKITSIDMSMTQKMAMVDGKNSIDVVKQNIRAKMLMPKDGDVQMEMTMTDPTTKEVTYAYFKDNYLYQEVMGQKYKTKMSMEQALQSSGSVSMMEMTEEMIKDAKFEVVEDGIKVTCKTDIYSMKDENGNTVASLLDDLDLPDDMKFQISKITTRVIIGYDGMLKSGTNTFGMKISDKDVNLEFKITQSFKVNSVNSITAINFPSNLGSYKLLV